MTEKRYFLHKHLIKNDVIHDKICHRWLKGEELESDMNTLYNKYSSLKRENEQLKKDLKIIEEHRKQETEYTARLEEKNGKLKSQLKGILKLTRKIEGCTHDMKLIGDFDD